MVYEELPVYVKYNPCFVSFHVISGQIRVVELDCNAVKSAASPGAKVSLQQLYNPKVCQ